MNKQWLEEEVINLAVMDITICQGEQKFCIPSKRMDYVSEDGTLTLPKEVDGVFYIVPTSEATHLFRRDVYIPGEAVRNSKDEVIGIKGLIYKAPNYTIFHWEW